MKYALAIAFVLTFAMSTMAAEVVIFSHDFEDGTVGGLIRIDRYDDDPTVVTSDADFPAAFPLPGGQGTQVLRCADDNNTFVGLSSAKATPAYAYVNRTDAGFVSATLAATIYTPASSATNANNYALVAVEDVDSPFNTIGTERYYRFGHRADGSSGYYLQYFDGAAFSVLGEDFALESTVTVPGWHTYEMQITPTQVSCEVDGVAPSWSPVTHSGLPAFTVGVLGFDLTTLNPILADNISIAVDGPSVPVELSVFSAN